VQIVYRLIKFQYRDNRRQTCRLSLFVHLASTSHKEVGERRISSGKAEESKRSLRVCPFYRYAVASGNGATDHEETARCEVAKH